MKLKLHIRSSINTDIDFHTIFFYKMRATNLQSDLTCIGHKFNSELRQEHFRVSYMYLFTTKGAKRKPRQILPNNKYNQVINLGATFYFKREN